MSIFGCFFGHSGVWGSVIDEEWTRVIADVGERDFLQKVQYRTCSLCGAVERRFVS